MRKEYEHLKVAMAAKDEEVIVEKGLNVDRKPKERPGEFCARRSVVARGGIVEGSVERDGIKEN